jgi:nucleoid DNA-binding protein
MDQTAVTTLRSIMMEEGRVCLPGLGTFVVDEQPATVSLLEAAAHPPTARITFNTNLITDDGRLRQRLPHPADAAAFLRHIREQLDRGQPVQLDGIGKLYRHPTGQVRFQPAGDNFSVDNFGLPALPVTPLVRKEPADPPPRSVVPRRKRRPSAHRQRGSEVRQWLWYAGGLVGTVLLIFLLFRVGGAIASTFANDHRPDDAEVRTPEVDRPETPAPEPVTAGSLQPDAPPLFPEESVANPQAPDRHTAIIAIGLYGRQRNVNKQLRRLREAGFTPHTAPEGRNTRVGVAVSYLSEDALLDTLQDLRARYTEDAFILLVDGEEQQYDQ